MLTEAQPVRRCARCGSVKPVAEFNVSARFGHQFYCRQCQRAWYQAHRTQHIVNVDENTERYRARNRAYVVEHLLTHPCVDCGETDLTVLDFDHVAGKTAAVSRLVLSASLERIAAEIAMCQIRCANCHMRRTAQQFGWRKAREVSSADVLEVRH